MSKHKKKQQKRKSKLKLRWVLCVGSLHDDRHGLISSHCKIDLVVFRLSLNDFPHIATSYERLRRKQLVELLQAKIDAAAGMGCTVIPFSSRDFDYMR